MRISSVSLFSLALGLTLCLSAICSGVGVARADSVIATIPVGPNPNEIAFDSFNDNLYVTNHGNNTVSVISGQTNKVIGNPIPVGTGPVGIAFDSSNGDLYVVNDGAFGTRGTVSVISGQTNTVIGNPIPVGLNPWDVAFDSTNGNLYVTNFSDNTVSVISGQTNTVIGNPIPVGTHPRGIAFDSANGDLYVANEYFAGFGPGTVSVISGQTNNVIGSPITVGINPLGIAFGPTNGDLYVGNINSRAVNPSDRQCNTVCNTVSIISGQTNTVIGDPITVGNFPAGIAFDSANGNVYVANFGDNNVLVISSQTNTVVSSPIPVVDGPYGIAFDPANGDIYVSNQRSNTVSVIATTPSPISPDTTVTSAVDGNGAVIQSGGTTFSTTIKLTFTATAGTNPIAGFQCSLDNGIFSSCLSPTTLTNLAVGPHTFQVRAVDSAGNKDPTPANFSWKIAAFHLPSHTTITSAVDGNGARILNGGTTTSNSITFTLAATAGTNPIAGFQCSLDNSQFSSCNSPASFNNLAAGPHGFIVAGVDSAGNKDPMPASFSWTMLTPAQGIEQLIQTINGMHLNPGTQTSLDAQLNGILTTLSLPIKNNLLSTCPHLNAFVNTVVPDYLHSGQLNPNQAAQIIQSAQNIQKALGCTGNGH